MSAFSQEMTGYGERTCKCTKRCSSLEVSFLLHLTVFLSKHITVRYGKANEREDTRTLAFLTPFFFNNSAFICSKNAADNLRTLPFPMILKVHTLFHDFCAAQRKVQGCKKIRHACQNKAVLVFVAKYVGRGKACILKNKSHDKVTWNMNQIATA